MKHLLVCSLHSFVDLITNSSSELFVCNTEKTVESVKELLQQLLNCHNAAAKDNCIFEDTFGRVELANYKFQWSKVPSKIQEEYVYYNAPYCRYAEYLAEENDEVKKLIRQENVLRMKLKKEGKEDTFFEARQPLWSKYGAKQLLAEGKLFIEFLKQNNFSTENIAFTKKLYKKAADEHLRHKDGLHYQEIKINSKQHPKLRTALQIFFEWKNYGITANKGDILIYSSTDNSIPYELFEMIVSYLNAERYHLG
jgi:hypothetical protein